MKALIQDRENIPALDQLLSYRGKHLADEGSLAGYNIQQGSFIDLMLPLLGGVGESNAVIQCMGGGVSVPEPMGLGCRVCLGLDIRGPSGAGGGLCEAHSGAQESPVQLAPPPPDFLAPVPSSPGDVPSSPASVGGTSHLTAVESTGVATSNWTQLEWNEVVESLVNCASKSPSAGRNWPLGEISDFSRALETLQHHGLDPEKEDPWLAVGLSREFAPGQTCWRREGEPSARFFKLLKVEPAGLQQTGTTVRLVSRNWIKLSIPAKPNYLTYLKHLRRKRQAKLLSLSGRSPRHCC